MAYQLKKISAENCQFVPKHMDIISFSPGQLLVAYIGLLVGKNIWEVCVNHFSLSNDHLRDH